VLSNGNKPYNYGGKEADMREEERADDMGPGVKRLRDFAKTTVIGMFACWLAQWMWWVGYVRAMGDEYCPPKLKDLGIVWTIFSGFGALFGGAV